MAVRSRTLGTPQSLDEQRRAQAQLNLQQQQRGISGTGTLTNPSAPLVSPLTQGTLIGATPEQFAQGQGTVLYDTQDTSSREFREAQLAGAIRPTAQRPSDVTAATRPLAGAPLKSPIAGAQGIPGQTGFNQQNMGFQQGVGFDASPLAFGKQIQDELGRIDRALSQTFDYSTGDTPQNFEARKSALNAQKESLLRQQAELRKQQREQEQQSLLGSAAAATAPVTPKASGSSAALSNLPPEGQFLLPFFQQFQDSINQSISENTAAYKDQLLGIRKSYSDMEDQLDKMKSGYEESSDSIKDLLDDVREQNEEYLAKQKEAEENQLGWERMKISREIAKRKREDHDSMVARIALGGGFGQDALMDAVAESDAQYDQQMNDLNTQFAFKRSDLTAKFSALYVENNNNYSNKTVENAKELRSALERIALQGMSNEQSKLQAETNAFKYAWDNQTTLRKDLANSILDRAKEISGIILNERNQKRQDEASAWDQLKWVKDTFGTGASEDLIKGISSKLPGVDVQALLSLPTLDEIEKKRKASSGVGGIGSFESYMMKSAAAPPSFNDFLKEKENEALSRGDVMFDTSASSMKRYKEEYEARLSISKKHDPAEILNRYAMKAGTLSGPSRKYSQNQLEEYLSSGQYQLASDFVDNTGDDIPSAQADDFIQALNARYNVQKMSRMFDEIGQIGPISGRLRELNPYDDRVVRFHQNLTQTIPGLARGIFKEVGVLTDTDIDRYTSSVGSPELTLGQAKTAYNDLIERVNVSMQNQISVWDANGKRIKGFRDLYESQPLNAVSNQQSTQADEDYAQSILSGK